MMAAPMTRVMSTWSRIANCFRKQSYVHRSFQLVHVNARCYAKGKLNATKLARKQERLLREMTAKLGGNTVQNGKARNKFSHIEPHGRSVPSLQKEKRAQQLNVILIDYICSILSSEDTCSEIAQLGVELSKVQITPDFGNIIVFWLANGDEERDDLVDQLLNAAKADIRSELIGYRVLGNVPPLLFRRDVTQSRVVQLDRLLQKADMGPDHVPRDLGEDMREDLIHQGQSLVLSKRLLQQKFDATFARGEQYVGDNRDGPGGSREVVFPGPPEGARSGDDVTPPERVDGVKSSVGGSSVSSDVGPSESGTSTYTTRSDNVVGGQGSNETDMGLGHTGVDSGMRPDDADVKGLRPNQNLNREKHTGKTRTCDPVGNVKLRSDVYDLDHAQLHEQILHAKRKMMNRKYQMPLHGSNVRDLPSAMLQGDLSDSASRSKPTRSGRRQMLEMLREKEVKERKKKSATTYLLAVDDAAERWSTDRHSQDWRRGKDTYDDDDDDDECYVDDDLPRTKS